MNILWRSMRVVLMGVALIVVLSRCAEADSGESAQLTEPLKPACPPQAKVWGIDIARYQHPGGAPIDWAAVAEEKRFVIIKATEGTGYINPYFAQDLAAARKAGLLVGAYHYLRFSSSGVAQADHFLRTLGSPFPDGDLPPLIDLEDTLDDVSTEQRVQTLRDWLGRVEQAVGRKPMIYSGSWYWSGDYLNGPLGLSEHPLMWAAYPENPEDVLQSKHCPRIPDDFGNLVIWQYQGIGGRTPGIVGDVDQDVFYGSLSELRAFARIPRIAASPTPEIPTQPVAPPYPADTTPASPDPELYSGGSSGLGGASLEGSAAEATTPSVGGSPSDGVGGRTSVEGRATAPSASCSLPGEAQWGRRNAVLLGGILLFGLRRGCRRGATSADQVAPGSARRLLRAKIRSGCG